MKRFLPRRRYVTYPGELGDLARGIAKGRLAPGATVREFETALADYHGGGHAIAVNSGRVALLVLLDALGVRPGDEILVPGYTLRALVALLADSGYRPVPVDIETHSFNMDVDHARTRIGPSTRAILATHLFGRPCAIERLARLARDADLLLVEDCAQALGAEVGARKVGSFGDGAILSFDLLKPINTFGGGALLTRNEETAARARAALQRFHPPGAALAKRIAVGLAEHLVLIGPAARGVSHALAHPITRSFVERSYRSMQDAVRPTEALFTDLQADIGLRLFSSLDGRVAVRRHMARRLAHELGERPALTVARGDNGYFFVRSAAGDSGALRRDLLAAGIDAGIGPEVADFCGDLGRADECPRARAAFDSAIQLPLHEGLSEGDLVRIAAACAGRLSGRTRAPTAARA